MRLLLLFGFVSWHVNNSIAYENPSDYVDVKGVIDSVGEFSSNFFQAVAAEGPSNMICSNSQYIFRAFMEDLAVAEKEPSNIICSPYSASMLLSLMSFGTRGINKMNMRLSLGFSQSDDIIEIGIKSLTKRLSAFQKVHLFLGTKIFFNGPIQNAEFKHVMEKTFNSISQNIDFTDKISVTRIINDWGASQTDNHINEIVQSADFERNTDVMLMNAVYFKGSWATQFKKNYTQHRPFFVNGMSKDVETMYQLGLYRYGELRDLNARFIKLPYESTAANDEISMYIILPNERNGIASLKKNIRNLTLTTLRGGTETKVGLYLPKFTIKSKFNLKVPFSKLGAIKTSRFGLILTRIASKPVHINKIIQNAFIEVNEKGKEVPGGSDYESLPKPVKFVVDRPFISIIATEPGLLLFGAIVMDPSY